MNTTSPQHFKYNFWFAVAFLGVMCAIYVLSYCK